MIEGIPDIDSPNFCPELWQRMFVLQLNDEFYVKPCCYASPSKNNQVLVADGDEIFETYNQHPSIQQIREDNKQGILDSGCEVCVHSEKLSGSSGRTRAIDQIKSTRCGTQLFARSIISPPYTKGTNQDTTIEYTFSGGNS